MKYFKHLPVDFILASSQDVAWLYEMFDGAISDDAVETPIPIVA
ncbi:hypothetical protein MGAST_22060 [Mycobacterium gastri 'Wayne']|nr:hypothetical protein MGAST_22060 [Mycobacterium gastri 'Wayne']